MVSVRFPVALQLVAVFIGCASAASKWTCVSMMPNAALVDNQPPQAVSMPFSISTDKNEYINGTGDQITVYLNSTGVQKIKGFLIQSRPDPGEIYKLIGDFSRPMETIQTCYDVTGVGLSGYGEDSNGFWPRDSLVLKWNAPDVAQGHVRFWVSIISDASPAKYWVMESSDLIREKGKPVVEVTTRKFTDTSLTLPIAVDGCGKSKSCYRNPPSCQHRQCDQIVTWRDNRNLLDFEMSAAVDGWVAIGFSDDKKMGRDDVFECVWNDETLAVEVRMSTNSKDGKHNDVIEENNLGLVGIETSRTDSRISCKFSRRKSIDLGSTFWEWENTDQEYHILMAHGDVDDKGNKKRHDLEPGKYPFVSKQKVRLSVNVDIDGNARYWLVKMHGCLMIIAWMMCCTTAIILAKYYKTMWPNDELCGTDVWFAVHRGIQCVTLGCTILGFILIFVHAGGYSQMPDLPDKAHPILGIIVTILCIINPLLSLCRCSPKSDNRPIFNWIHWFFGTIAAVLSMPTLFLGLNLHKAFVPWWATWVMVAFMLFHLVVELMLEIHGCINSKKQRVRNDEYDMRKKGDRRGDYYRLEPEPVGTRFKKRTLAIYLAVVIICGLIMIITIAFG